MKHKTLWTFLLWVLTLCIFELPLLLLPIGEIVGTSNFVYIIIIDIYSIASLFALIIVKYGVKKIDILITTLKKSSAQA